MTISRICIDVCALKDHAPVERRHRLDKTWEIPAHSGKGPVTVMLRMPDVTITDSQGRYIMISPEQSDLVGARMSYISDWIRDGADD